MGCKPVLLPSEWMFRNDSTLELQMFPVMLHVADLATLNLHVAVVHCGLQWVQQRGELGARDRLGDGAWPRLEVVGLFVWQHQLGQTPRIDLVLRHLASYGLCGRVLPWLSQKQANSPPSVGQCAAGSSFQHFR